MGVGSVGLVADGDDAVAVIVPCAMLDIEGVSAQIIYELAIVVGAEVAVLAYVGVVVADAIAVVVAAIVNDADVVAHWLAFDVVRVVVVAGDLRWLWLRYWGCIAVSNS